MIVVQKYSLAMPLVPETKVKGVKSEKKKSKGIGDRATPRRPFFGNFALLWDFIYILFGGFWEEIVHKSMNLLALNNEFQYK